MKELLTITAKELRKKVLASLDGAEDFNTLLGNIYGGLQTLLDSDDLNPREQLNLYENGKKIVSQLKIVMTEYEARIPKILRVKMKLINEQIYCTPLRELKEEASKFIDQDDIHQIILKMDTLEAVELWMLNHGDTKTWDSVERALYYRFSDACKEMKRRNRIEYNLDKLDKGRHNFKIRDLRKLDADLLLDLVKTFSATAIDDEKIEVSFGKLIFINTLYKNYSRETIKKEPSLTNHNQSAKLLLEGLEQVAEMKFSDYLSNNSEVFNN